MLPPLPDLPILEALPELKAACTAHRSVLLEAPPGAGKSTVVPLALLEEPWLDGRRILMLEPRRIAARSVATRMAQLLGEAPGDTVGYRTRLATRVGPRTRIEVLTEGILTRMLQTDPALEAAAIVVFDEFHERSLQADLALALALDARANLREDLRLLIMSATLATPAIAQLLGDAAVITAAGRSFDIATSYRARSLTGAHPADLPRIAALTTLAALAAEPGDALVFLPGQAEIHRTARELESAGVPEDCDVERLYGDLPAAAQDRILRRTAGNRRRIVLATNVAETSLTIEGIRIVVDSGLERRARFDPATGMSRLETVRISRASADQRRGRAGRLASGHCHRLWTAGEHALLAAESPAEILAADLAPLALELAQWGAREAGALAWLDTPPAAALAQARDLLTALEAIDAERRITPHGRAMLRLGVHPRLAHMLIAARTEGRARLAAEIAALLTERDPLRVGPAGHDVDLRSRLEWLRGTAPDEANGLDPRARKRIAQSADLLERRLGGARRAGRAAGDDIPAAGEVLARAYPDRIAQSRGGDGRYLLASGRGARLAKPQLLGRSDWLVVADLDAGDREALIRLAAPIELATIEALNAPAIVQADRIEWDAGQRVVTARRERRLGALILEQRPLTAPDGDRVREVLLEGIAADGITALPWSRAARSLQARIEFVRQAGEDIADLPACDDASLLADIATWLGPWTDGMTRGEELARLDLHAILLARLSHAQRRELERLAPEHFVVPSGSRVAIDYSGATPVLAARLQELFGMTETPRIAGGRVPLTIVLLSPARRPVQVTRDLASFWANTYSEVRRELKGRYPRHYWPDDPRAATPTARVKPRGR